jgi:hypothetical protein
MQSGGEALLRVLRQVLVAPLNCSSLSLHPLPVALLLMQCYHEVDVPVNPCCLQGVSQ